MRDNFRSMSNLSRNKVFFLSVTSSLFYFFFVNFSCITESYSYKEKKKYNKYLIIIRCESAGACTMWTNNFLFFSVFDCLCVYIEFHVESCFEKKNYYFYVNFKSCDVDSQMIKKWRSIHTSMFMIHLIMRF